MNAVMNRPAVPASRATLWWIVALLAAPVALATGLYLSGWQPAGKPRGELVQPPRLLPPEMLAATAQARGKWLLLYDAHAVCDAACGARLDEIRRVHVSLNKDMDRVRRGVIADAAGTARAAVAGQPDVAIVAPATGWDGAGGMLLLVDPDGRIALRYDPSIEPKAIRSDVDRLLRFAWNG